MNIEGEVGCGVVLGQICASLNRLTSSIGARDVGGNEGKHWSAIARIVGVLNHSLPSEVETVCLRSSTNDGAARWLGKSRRGVRATWGAE